MWLSTPRGLQFHHRLLEDQEEGVLALEVKDSTTLCASFQGGKIRIFDLATLTMLRTLSAGTEDVLSLARVGDACASTCADGSLQIWNRSFSLESSRSVHEGIALSCSASPDGQFIYTGGNDGTLKVWYRNSTQQALAQQSEALQGESGPTSFALRLIAPLRSALHPSGGVCAVQISQQRRVLSRGGALHLSRRSDRDSNGANSAAKLPSGSKTRWRH